MIQETARINFEATNLDVVEGRIKAIGGAINVLGGSIEVVVGAMGLIGIDEKVTKQFQEAATSAIAFADGAKRVFEGYKELREAADLFRKAQGAGTAVTVANTAATARNNAVQVGAVGILGRVRIAFASLTATMAANPFVAIATAIGLITAAFIGYKYATDGATESVDDFNQAQKNLGNTLSSDDFSTYMDLYVAGLKARGASTEFVLGEEIKLYKDRQSELTALVDANNKEIERLEILKGVGKIGFGKSLEEQKAIYQAQIDDLKESNIKSLDEQSKLIKETKKKEIELAGVQRENAEKRKEDALRNANEISKIENEAIANTISLLKEGRDRELFELDRSFREREIKVKGNKSAEQAVAEEKRIRISQINTKWDILDKEAADKATADKLAKQKEAAQKEKEQREKEGLERLKDNLKFQLELATRDAKNEDDRILRLRKFAATQRELYKNDAEALAIVNQVIAGTFVDGLQTNYEEMQEWLNKLVGEINKYAQLASIAIDSLSGIQRANHELRLNQIEAEYQERAKGVVGSEEQIAEQLQRLEVEKNKKLEDEKERNFERSKKYQIAEATITGLQGAATAFATAFSLGPSAGPVVGGILAALVLANTAAQINMIKKQKYIRSDAGASGLGGGIGGGTRGGTGLSGIGGGNFLQPIPNPGDPGNRTGSSNNPFGFMRAPTTSPNTPIRAYVVASDVSNGLEAERALNTRRRL